MRARSNSKLFAVVALVGGSALLAVIGVVASAGLAAEHRRMGARTLDEEIRNELRSAGEQLTGHLETFRTALVPDDLLPHTVVTARFTPAPDPRPPSPFGEAERAEFIDRDPAAALKAYIRTLELGDLDPTWRVEGLRNAARLWREAGAHKRADEALEFARLVEGADDSAVALARYDAARHAPAEEPRKQLARALVAGAFPAAHPAVRCRLLDRLGASPSEAPALRALAVTLEAGARVDALIALPDGRVAWPLAHDGDAYRFAVAGLDEVLSATVPGVAEGRWAPALAGAVPLPRPPFPEGALSATPTGFASIERQAANKRWMLLAPTLVVAAMLALGAWGLHRGERQRRALDERREAFLLSATHELKTPIANVRLYAETLAAHGAEDPDSMLRFVNTIDAEARRLERRVQEMLMVAAGRDERAEVSTEFAPLPVLEALVEDWRARPDVAQLELSATVQDKAMIRGTPALFAGAVEAVLDNAAKFAPGEPVTVRLACDASYVTVDVEDRGPGIPAPDRERVFQPFERLNRDVTAAKPGTGLGLALARRSARACGGDVTAEEAPSGGARLRVRFPRALAGEEVAACPAS